MQHTVVYILAKLIPGLVGVMTTAGLTRLLDPTSYGIYGLGLVMMSLGSYAFFDWLGIAFMRFYEARQRDPATIGTFIWLFLALVLVSGGVFLTCWGLGVVPHDDLAAAAAGLCLLWAYSWFELVSKIEVASFRPASYFRMNLTRALLILGSTVFVAWWTRNPAWSLLGTAAGMLGGAFFGSPIPFGQGRWHFDRALAVQLCRYGLPLTVSLTLSSLSLSGIRGLVGALGTTEDLGLYTAAFALVQNSLAVIGGGLSSATFPLAVRALETGNPGAVRQQLRANATLLLAVLAPTCLGMALAAPEIAAVMVGPKFAEGVARITPWMAAGSFLGSVRFHYLDHAFQLGKRPDLLAWLTAVVGATAVGLSFWLIPRDGAVGAAIAMLVSSAVACVLAWFAGRRALPLPLPIGAALKVGACCLIMTTALLLLPVRRNFAGLGLEILVGAGTYFAAAFAADLLDVRSHLLRTLVAARLHPRLAAVPLNGRPTERD